MFILLRYSLCFFVLYTKVWSTAYVLLGGRHEITLLHIIFCILLVGKTSDFGNFFGDVFLVKRVFDYNLKALVVEEGTNKKKGSGMRI